jgi:hypothetical protein
VNTPQFNWETILPEIVETVSQAVNEEMQRRGWSIDPAWIRENCSKTHKIINRPEAMIITDCFMRGGIPFFKAETTLKFDSGKVTVSHAYRPMNEHLFTEE